MKYFRYKWPFILFSVIILSGLALTQKSADFRGKVDGMVVAQPSNACIQTAALSFQQNLRLRMSEEEVFTFFHQRPEGVLLAGLAPDQLIAEIIRFLRMMELVTQSDPNPVYDQFLGFGDPNTIYGQAVSSLNYLSAQAVDSYAQVVEGDAGGPAAISRQEVLAFISRNRDEIVNSLSALSLLAIGDLSDALEHTVCQAPANRAPQVFEDVVNGLLRSLPGGHIEPIPSGDLIGFPHVTEDIGLADRIRRYKVALANGAHEELPPTLVSSRLLIKFRMDNILIIAALDPGGLDSIQLILQQIAWFEAYDRQLFPPTPSPTPTRRGDDFTDAGFVAATPTSTPVPRATATPTIRPTTTPTKRPTATPTRLPSATPTKKPPTPTPTKSSVIK